MKLPRARTFWLRILPAFLLLALSIVSIRIHFKPVPESPEVWAIQRKSFKVEDWIYEKLSDFDHFLLKRADIESGLAGWAETIYSPDRDHIFHVVTLDRNGRECFTPILCRSYQLANDFTIVELDQGSGVLSKNGAWLVSPIYGKMDRYSDHWFKTTLNDEKGYVNLQGVWQTEDPSSLETPYSPRTESVEEGDYKRHHLKVQHSESGDILLDESGHVLFQERNVKILGFRSWGNKRFGDNIIKVKIGGKSGYLREDGTWLIESKFDALGARREGLTPAAIFLDHDKPGMDLQMTNIRMGFIDDSGSWVIPPDFLMTVEFSDGLAGALDPKTKLWGFIDHSGKWKIQPQFPGEFYNFSQEIGTLEDGFVQGFCTLRSPKGYGMIDYDGKWIIPPRFGYINWGTRLHDPYHLGIFEKDHQYGLMDKSGTILAQPIYSDIRFIFDERFYNPYEEGQW